jgi:hypothetical protein
MKVIALVDTGKRYPALWNTEGRRIFGVDWAPVAPLYRVKRERRKLYPVAIGSIIVDGATANRIERIVGSFVPGDDGRRTWQYAAVCAPLAHDVAA